MSRITLQNIGLAIKSRRGKEGIRDTAKAIGISTATLSRIENGKLPDIETFKKLCSWLNIDAGKVLGCDPKQESTTTEMFVHFKADKNLKPKTADALAKMILAVQSNF